MNETSSIKIPKYLKLSKLTLIIWRGPQQIRHDFVYNNNDDIHYVKSFRFRLFRLRARDNCWY